MFKVAITGTNGKTSTVILACQLMSACDLEVASLGTLGLISKDYSDPDPILIGNNAVSDLVNELGSMYKLDAFLFEAYSAAIAGRMYDNIDIDLAVLTNITLDHLEYHGSEEKYIQAKLRLFRKVLKQGKRAIFCLDDKFSAQLIAICKYRNINYFSFGSNEKSCLQLRSVETTNDKSKVLLRYKNIDYESNINFFGKIFIENWMCALSIALIQGIDINNLMNASENLKLPEGRLEEIGKFNSATIYVDYAHNASGLESVLKILKNKNNGRLHLVFGCGGNRDKDKRRTMGYIANTYADKVYVTNDNPRFERAKKIRLDILKYCLNGIEFHDRKEAIHTAIKNLKPQDNLIITGKGHEKYKEVKGIKTYFSDKYIILKYITQ